MRLQQLDISNFRGIRQLKIDLQGQVTLIAGRNNCGKSTLLEAVEMLARASDPIKVAHISQRRELKCDTLDDLKTFFYGQDDTLEVKLIGRFDPNAVRTVELSGHTVREGDLSSASVLKSQPKECRLRYWEQSGEKDTEAGALRFYEIIPGDLKWSVENDVQLLPWNCAFCSAGNEPKTCEIVSELKNACNEDWLIEYLRTLDANVVSISSDKDKVLLKTKSSGSALPLQLMGDGVNKVVKILGLMCSVGSGGVVCIDEVDNGLHYSAMRSFVDLVVRVAREKNVQVLMTTHNLEFMRHISSYLGDASESFGFLRMVRCANGETKAFDYNAREYVASLKGGVELR